MVIVRNCVIYTYKLVGSGARNIWILITICNSIYEVLTHRSRGGTNIKAQDQNKLALTIEKSVDNYCWEGICFKVFYHKKALKRVG